MRCVLILLALLWPAMTQAGPWPRAPGTGLAVASVYVGTPLAQPYAGLYAEFGLMSGVAGGVDTGRAVSGSVKAVAFLRRSVRLPGDTGVVAAAEIGLGRIAGQAVLRPGLSLGHGLEEWLDGGWLAVDTVAEIGLERSTFDIKTDVTFGLRLDERRNAMVQLQTGQSAGDPRFARLVPSVVTELRSGMKLELGLTQSLRGRRAPAPRSPSGASSEARAPGSARALSPVSRHGYDRGHGGRAQPGHPAHRRCRPRHGAGAAGGCAHRGAGGAGPRQRRADGKPRGLWPGAGRQAAVAGIGPCRAQPRVAADPRCSLLVDGPGGRGDPLNHPRITLQARVGSCATAPRGTRRCCITTWCSNPRPSSMPGSPTLPSCCSMSSVRCSTAGSARRSCWGRRTLACKATGDAPARQGFTFRARRGTSAAMIDLPQTRGKVTPERPLSGLTWLRVGGPAQWLFQPADADDLAAFLRALPAEVPVFPVGVGSNLIVRDGGIRGVVIRLGRGFNHIRVEGDTSSPGRRRLMRRWRARRPRRGATWPSCAPSPAPIGGAVRMNAGCYGRYVADHLAWARVVTRAGETVTLTPADLNLAYRDSDLPAGAVIVEAAFAAPAGDPAALEVEMADQLARRDATQPTRERSAGSTFRNPSGASSTGRADDVHDLKAWKLIDAAGMRGARLGGAQMSDKHPNFLINTGNATAAELEALGELVRKKVYDSSAIKLEWEIMRVGDPGAND